MGSYTYNFMGFTRKFRSLDAQPPADVCDAHLSYCSSTSSSSSSSDGLRRFLSQVQGESPADVDRILATFASTRSPAPALRPLDDFFGFLFSPELNPPITRQNQFRSSQVKVNSIPQRFHFYTASVNLNVGTKLDMDVFVAYVAMSIMFCREAADMVESEHV